MSAISSISELEQHLRRRIEALLSARGVDQVAVELEPPPNPELGDYGFPCFPLAKVLRKAPAAIAAQLAEGLEPDALVERAHAVGPYLNLVLRRQEWLRVVIGQVLTQRNRFGAAQADPPRRWMIEYSSPNTNKPLHLGHLRNNLLGASLARIVSHYGHRVVQVNLVNDRGVHICKSMLAYKLWTAGETPETAGKKGDRFVGDLYVMFERRLAEEYREWLTSAAAEQRFAEWAQQQVKAGERGAKRKPEATREAFAGSYKDAYFNAESDLGGQVRQMLRQWEAGDPQVLALWRKLNEWVFQGFEVSYRRMGVSFDEVQRESETYKLGKALVEEGVSAGVLSHRDDGAVVCDLSQVGLSGQKVLLRADGTSVYMTQDLGTAKERFDRHRLDRLIYVVGDEQNYHFEVLFKVLGLLRPGLSERCFHLSYGMIRLPEGRMKSREGTVVDADNLMDEVCELARGETQSRADEGKAHTEGIDQDELARRAEHIGMAALKYLLLRYSPRTSFEYNPRECIDFLGQTGPYCLFNFARTRSLLRKAGGEPPWDVALLAHLGTAQELQLVRFLAEFPSTIHRAVEGLDPSRIAVYAFELCKRFAFIFTDKENHPIVTCEDSSVRAARLLLVSAISETLRVALGLLGIEVLEEM